MKMNLFGRIVILAIVDKCVYVWGGGGGERKKEREIYKRLLRPKLGHDELIDNGLDMGGLLRFLKF